MKVIDTGTGHANILQDPIDVRGWEVLHIEDWKPGIKRLHLRTVINGPTFIMVYAAEGMMPKIVDGVCVS